MAVPRMRTVPEAYNELKRLDADTAITLTALRRMVKRGELPVVHVGNKRLVNLDTLLDRLYNPAEPEPLQQPYGVIRRIV